MILITAHIMYANTIGIMFIEINITSFDLCLRLLFLFFKGKLERLSVAGEGV